MAKRDDGGAAMMPSDARLREMEAEAAKAAELCDQYPTLAKDSVLFRDALTCIRAVIAARALLDKRRDFSLLATDLRAILSPAGGGDDAE